MKRKFTSWGDLEDFMYSKGWNHVLWDIEEIEMSKSKRAGERTDREKIRQRIVDWFNMKPRKTDVVSHRASFILVNELNKKIEKLGKVI